MGVSGAAAKMEGVDVGRLATGVAVWGIVGVQAHSKVSRNSSGKNLEMRRIKKFSNNIGLCRQIKHIPKWTVEIDDC